MPIAALSDVHGNIAALDAALAEVEPLGLDVVVCGDVVTGPFSAQVLDRIMALPRVRFVRGNVERHVLEGSDEFGKEWEEERRRLGEERLAAVASWPKTLELEVDGLGRVLCCHSTPGSEDPVYTPATPDDEVAALLGAVDADVLVCGHTHMQYDRGLASGLRVVNPGSIGLPYEGQRGAYWAVLGPGVDFRRSEYDVEAAVEAIRASGAPVAEEALGMLLDPPDQETATAEFERLRGA